MPISEWISWPAPYDPSPAIAANASNATGAERASKLSEGGSEGVLVPVDPP